MLEYTIVGGCIKIDKGAFTQDMLRKDSLIRSILNWKAAGGFSSKHPWVSGPGDDNLVTINFTSNESVEMNRPPNELLDELKSRYPGRISGKVSFRATYSMYGGVFHFEVDLGPPVKKAP